MCSFLILLPYSSNGHSPHDVIAAIATSEDGQTVFTSSRGILLKSEDGGINWLRTMKGMYCLEGTCGKWTEQFLVTSPNYNKDETVFSGTKKYGLQKSIDGGFNWLPIGHPDENEASGDGHFKHCLEKGHFTLSPKFGDTDKLVLVIGERHNRKGEFMLYRSTDGGDSFQGIDLSQAFGNGRYPLDGCAALYSATPDVYFLGTKQGDLLVSEDAGVTWKAVEKAGGFPTRANNVQIRMITGRASDHKDGIYDLYFMTYTTLELAIIKRPKNNAVWKWTDSRVLQESSSDMGFLNVVAHYGGDYNDDDTTLFLMQSGCGNNPDCNRDLFVSQDNGNTFFHDAHAENLTGVFWDGHIGTDFSTKFHYDEFYDVKGVPNTPIVFLGTFEGIFRSDDNGQSWAMLDTMSHWITSLSVGRASGEHNYFVDFCTYTQGCFGGSITIDPKYLTNDDPEAILHKNDGSITPIPWYNKHDPQSRYEVVVVSPSHDKDNVVIRSVVANKDTGKRLQRTTDNFGPNTDFVGVPALKDDENDKTVVHTMWMSHRFDQDKLVFICGHNIGLAVSQDSGHHFVTMWDPTPFEPFGTVTKVAVSPHYETDGTIACLVDNYMSKGRVFYAKYDANVYITTDRGASWHKITQESQPWENLVAVSSTSSKSATPGVAFIAIHDDGSLNAWTEHGKENKNPGWQKITNSYFDKVAPDGYGVNGVVSSPHGDHLLAAFEQGGAVRFDNFNADSMQFETSKTSQTGLDSHTSRDFDVKFVYDVRKNWLRGIGDCVDFSPNYEEDQVIFAASFYSLFVTVDQGAHWKEVFRQPHANTKTWDDDHKNVVVKKTGPGTDHIKQEIVDDSGNIIMMATTIVVISLVVVICRVSTKTVAKKRANKRAQAMSKYNHHGDRVVSSYTDEIKEYGYSDDEINDDDDENKNSTWPPPHRERFRNELELGSPRAWYGRSME